MSEKRVATLLHGGSDGSATAAEMDQRQLRLVVTIYRWRLRLGRQLGLQPDHACRAWFDP
ncbi:hypothetical protein AB9E34_30015 [Rhizobium leguminosarum]|uniref:hypothetical protein n=1 Tax=Rhizobium leguminosarum TaxID=384 RepID=UPI003F962042